MLPPPRNAAPVPVKGVEARTGVCLLRPNRTGFAAFAATFESLRKRLRNHRVVTRIALASLSFALLFAVTQQAAPAIQAGPEAPPLVPESILPKNLGVAVDTNATISLPFDAAMDRASVEAALQVLPAQKVELAWSEDSRQLLLRPANLWRAEEDYLIVVGAAAAAADGQPLERARRFSFSTEDAPAVTDFQVRLAAPTDPVPLPSVEAVTAITLDAGATDASAGTQPPDQLAEGVSATSAITVSFSSPMDRADVEEHFAIAPDVDGELRWSDGNLVFEPSERLEPGTRYTISVIGAHDAEGNPIGGKANFSFVVQAGAQLTKSNPEADATGVEPATVEMWFSQPMDVDATNAAFGLTDTSTGALVGGLLNWNKAATQLIYTPDNPFAAGRTFSVALGEGAKDAFGNPVTVEWSFATPAAPVQVARSTTTTRSAPTTSAPVVPPAAPATSLAGYALNQVNAARAAYGFGPVVLDANVSAAASAHAWDQARNNYFSHVSLDGRTREDRLRAAGVSFGWSGENQCYRVGMSEQGTLDWCHAQFMAEPYPGQWNHIANILNPNARRMGVGIATVGGKTVVTWNFTD